MSKPGPKPDPTRKMLRRLFSEWSDRTFATYYRAPNVNVSKFARIAEDCAAGPVNTRNSSEPP
jgi:hypothetical protein